MDSGMFIHPLQEIVMMLRCGDMPWLVIKSQNVANETCHCEQIKAKSSCENRQSDGTSSKVLTDPQVHIVKNECLSQKSIGPYFCVVARVNCQSYDGIPCMILIPNTCTG